MKNVSRMAVVCVLGVLGWTGCAAESSVQEVDEQLTVCYRGQRVPASLIGGELVIEGDILVAASDQWCSGEMTEDGKKVQGVRIQGESFRWPDSEVPYRFGPDLDLDGDGSVASDFTSTEEQTIRTRMDELEELVPGLTFREEEAGDTDIVEFRPSLTGCNSSVGRVGGVQVINAPDWCLGSRSISHEMLHALGVFHQHTRKDRNDSVTINWSNIRGCTSSATSPSDCGATACSGNLADCGCTAAQVQTNQCYMAGNFMTNSARADIGGYDYDSVMHYPAFGFSKGGATITTIDPTASIGQRTFISAGDTEVLRSMYPQIQLHQSVFVTPGVPVELCALSGRRDDAATKYRLINPGGSTAFEFGGNYETFTEDVQVTLYERECGARSNFWSGNYDYPNSSESEYGGGSDFDELFETEGYVTLMTAGLIPTLL